MIVVVSCTILSIAIILFVLLLLLAPPRKEASRWEKKRVQYESIDGVEPRSPRVISLQTAARARGETLMDTHIHARGFSQRLPRASASLRWRTSAYKCTYTHTCVHMRASLHAYPWVHPYVSSIQSMHASHADRHTCTPVHLHRTIVVSSSRALFPALRQHYCR